MCMTYACMSTGAILCHVMSWHGMSCHVMSWLCHAMSCHVVVMSCHVMSCRVHVNARTHMRVCARAFMRACVRFEDVHACLHACVRAFWGAYMYRMPRTYRRCMHIYPQAGLRAPAESRQWDIYVYTYTKYTIVSCLYMCMTYTRMSTSAM